MARPLKFCMLSIFYPPYSFGGDAMYLYRIVNALARHGHEVDVIHCVDSYRVLNSRPPKHDFPHPANVTVHSLKSDWGWLSPLLSQQTGQPFLKRDKIQAVLEGKKFDVIHFHNISLFGPGVLTIRPSYDSHIKLYTMHEHWLVCPMHVLWKYNRRVCDRPSCFTCSLAFKRPPQWWRYTNLLERTLGSVDAFISPSLFTRDMHHGRGFPRPIAHIPYFVSGPENTGTDDFPRHPRPYFLFVGRLEKIKGLQTLLPVFRNYPHADLLVAGTGTYESALRQMATGMSNVHFLGTQPQSRLASLYRQAIAVLVPSICYEVFGIIIIEGFTHRTPAIVHRLGGLAEVIEQSRGGRTYSNTEELLQAMEELRTQPTLRRDLGQNGYKAWRQHWSEEAHLEMYFSLREETARKKLGHVGWQVQKERSSGQPTGVATG